MPGPSVRAPDRCVAPRVLEPGDPCAGDEVLYAPGNFDNAVICGAKPDPETFFADDAALHAVYLDILAGRRPWSDPELPRLCAALGISPTIRHDTRRPRIAEVEVPDALLADVTEDFVPDIGLVVERIVGDDFPPPIGAFAALAFLNVAVEGCRALDLWAEEETDRPFVRAARVIDASPACVYLDGVPVLPLAAQWTPTSGPPGIYVARAYRVGDDWAFGCRMDLPRLPSVAAVTRRLGLELIRIRRFERRSSFEDALRLRSEVLYRTCAEAR